MSEGGGFPVGRILPSLDVHTHAQACCMSSAWEIPLGHITLGLPKPGRIPLPFVQPTAKCGSKFLPLIGTSNTTVHKFLAPHSSSASIDESPKSCFSERSEHSTHVATLLADCTRGTLVRPQENLQKLSSESRSHTIPHTEELKSCRPSHVHPTLGAPYC